MLDLVDQSLLHLGRGRIGEFGFHNPNYKNNNENSYDKDPYTRKGAN
jgi:hypothetical protein